MDEIEGIASARPTSRRPARRERAHGTARRGHAATGSGECSVAAWVGCTRGRAHDAGPELGLPPRPRRLAPVWTVEGSDGWFATFTEAGIVAKTGLNAFGLAITLNYLASSADGGIDGVPVHIALRMLLDSCHDERAAERLIDSLRVSASACVRSRRPRRAVPGRSHLVRVLPARHAVRLRRRPRRAGAHEPLPRGAGGARPALEGQGAASTLRRLAHVRAGLRQAGAVTAPSTISATCCQPSRPSPCTGTTRRLAAVGRAERDAGDRRLRRQARRMWIRADGGPDADLSEVVCRPEG